MAAIVWVPVSSNTFYILHARVAKQAEGIWVAGSQVQWMQRKQAALLHWKVLPAVLSLLWKVRVRHALSTQCLYSPNTHHLRCLRTFLGLSLGLHREQPRHYPRKSTITQRTCWLIDVESSHRVGVSTQPKIRIARSVMVYWTIFKLRRLQEWRDKPRRCENKISVCCQSDRHQRPRQLLLRKSKNSLKINPLAEVPCQGFERKYSWHSGARGGQPKHE